MTEIPGIDPLSEPSGAGCADCEAGDGAGWWLHLRRCAQCGRIGCCDSSPSQHASRHASTADHPVVCSFEPGENWFWDYRTDEFFEGPSMAPPLHHPPGQTTPGPSGRVPADWENHLH